MKILLLMEQMSKREKLFYLRLVMGSLNLSRTITRLANIHILSITITFSFPAQAPTVMDIGTPVGHITPEPGDAFPDIPTEDG